MITMGKTGDDIMSFNANWDDRISRDNGGIDIVKNATVLGHSDSENGCYWTCYQLAEKYYIGLGDECDIWEVEKSDIDDYNNNPV